MKIKIHLPVEKYLLKNRIHLLVSPNRNVPMVSIVAYCDTGILCEPEEKAGISHLISLLLDEGSKYRSGEAIQEELESVGGHLEIGASGASVILPSEECEVGLKVLAEILMHPVFPQRAVRGKRDLMLSEIIAAEDDSQNKASRLFRELVYGKHPLHRPSIGYAATVAKLRRKDLQEFHKRFYGPEKLTLAIVGDVSFAHAKRLVMKYFAKWNHRAEPMPPLPIIPQNKQPVTKIIYDKHRQVHIYLGHLGIRRNDADYYKLLVMDHILGTGPGFTDRLSRRLRDEHGLAYTVFASITSSAGTEPGTFLSYIGTSPQHYTKAVQGILKEIKFICSKPPTRAELLLAQDYLIGSFVLGLQKNISRAMLLINQERFHLGDDYLENYPAKIQAVAREQVLEVARRHLHPQRYVLAAVGPIKNKGLE